LLRVVCEQLVWLMAMVPDTYVVLES
jgi:hypothetical protein